MTMRDYGLYAAAFMILAGVTMLVLLWWEREKARREIEWRDWMEHEEEGLARVTWEDPDSFPIGDVVAMAERLRMIEGQDPVR